MMSKKEMITIGITIILIIAFLDRCTPVNISTNDIFRSGKLKQSVTLENGIVFGQYEIIQIKGTLPILYDSTSSCFYLKNDNGLAKINASGEVVIDNALTNEKITSTIDFLNYLPYVFTRGGVYDFSGDETAFIPFSQIDNVDQNMPDDEFKSRFEKLYHDAAMVVYENNKMLNDADGYPMFFKVGDQWQLLFTQKGEYRFSFNNYTAFDKQIIGQADFQNFPSKLNGRKLIVLKDRTKKQYTTTHEPKNDVYFDTYYTEILRERKLDYHSDNTLKIISYKKLGYYSVGNPFDLPDWTMATFHVHAYYQLCYDGAQAFFHTNTFKYRGGIQNDFTLFEIPKHMRKQSKVAFIMNKDSLYVIRPKKNK